MTRRATLSIVVAILAAVLGAAFLLPETSERHGRVAVEAPPRTLHLMLTDLPAVAPRAHWLREAEAVTTEGPRARPGSHLDWRGAPAGPAEGRLELTMARPYDRVEWRLEGPGFGPVTVSAEIVPAGEGGADLAHRLTRPHAGPPWRRLAGWWAARRELAFAEDALVGLARAAERLPPPVERELVAETVRYRAGEVELRGHLVYDAHLRRAPAVLVVHEWWGQNDYARLRAHMLAELGYVALAVDMYGEGRLAEHPDEAGRFAGAVLQNRERARARFEAALDFLRGHPKVDPERIAAIGYCFGGAVVLAMVREGLDLDLAASFHGGLPPGAEQGAGAGFAGRVLVFHGGADPLVDGEAMRRFVDDLRTRGVRAEFVEYPGAKHGFSNPDADDLGERFGLPLAYDIEADQDSWRRLSAALAEVFSAP